ncbi:unnamed protein product [Zymoseptoria tritici ST99CH_3D7]|uniref:Uncharacterized protein n=2 Tax=Zymoseptoria tritici TaxID=1047171 RepID=A0A1X7RY88_ZYMT9|nr:unnamed protein product [Zymoseptoria tritici ST99CH_3D7]SMR55216.1 unnamed protein product [Zymoseptoria tritici ST99CH_1E4]
MYGPLLVHNCSTCNYNTTVDPTSTVWIERHTCNYCGTTSCGAQSSDQSNHVTMDSHQQDELAALFAQSMHVSFAPPQQTAVVQQEVIIESLPQQTFDEKTPITYISAHYTHSTHLAPTNHSSPSTSPPPPYASPFPPAMQDTQTMPEAMAQTLLQHSIDPATLLPSQIHLFLHADYEQRLRLLELWRISPPSYAVDQARYEQTTIEAEERQAKMRFEEHLREQAKAFQQLQKHSEEMFDTHEPFHMQQVAEVEPYIVNGYDADQSKHSVDPVYAATAMQDQYGRYEQMRCHADWERMNGGDDEMVM